MNNKSLFGYLFLLPLIFAGWAGWQIFRSSQNPESESKLVAQIQSAIVEMTAMQQENPTQTLNLPGIEYAMTPNVALAQFKRDLADAERESVVARIQKKIPPVSLLTSLAAIVIAALTILKVKSASQLAMKSRDHLLRAFTSTRHLLPLASTGVTVALALSLSGLLIYECVSIWNADLGERARIKLIALCGIMALVSL